ncbi:MAG: 16S rRNA processing protein RimM [Paludibacteraceae bacterium]|jgi:16S rRNA processing protein RimM|nr:16S rRNA processing protein RimM [Paludibacteraceae bacterium]
MITHEEVISIGRITRTHGKRGELQCLMTNEYWDNADAKFLILKLDNILVPFTVLDWRGKGSDSLIFKLEYVNDEQQAQRLIGNEAFMLLSDMSEEDELLPTWQSLQGYYVIDTDQGDLGLVADVDESTINTLITLEDGRMIPIHEDFIIEINSEDKRLTICLPFIL